MIELLLQAERALTVGKVGQAERLYRQAAEADPRNAIAVVGLARVALEHADEAEAYRLARSALAIDPENVAAVRLAARLEEVLAARGQPAPERDEPSATREPVIGPGPTIEPLRETRFLPETGPEASLSSEPSPTARPANAAPRPSLIERLLGRRRS